LQGDEKEQNCRYERQGDKRYDKSGSKRFAKNYLALFKDKAQKVPENQEDHEQQQDYIYINQGEHKNIAADRKGNLPDLKDHSFKVGQNRYEDKADDNCVSCTPSPDFI
jgi:hypothetical protein